MVNHANEQAGSVGKEILQVKRDLMNILPKDLTLEQVATLKKTVKMAVINGFAFDKTVKKRLLSCEVIERLRETLMTLDDKVADETNNRRLAEIGEPQDRLVQSGLDDGEYDSDIGPVSERVLEEFESRSTRDALLDPGDPDRPEESYSSFEIEPSLTRKVPLGPGTLDQREWSSTSSEEKDETCFESYNPWIGFFT
jgi:hypothetical protein